jgi:hypothetical protein
MQNAMQNAKKKYRKFGSLNTFVNGFKTKNAITNPTIVTNIGMPPSEGFVVLAHLTIMSLLLRIPNVFANPITPFVNT